MNALSGRTAYSEALASFHADRIIATLCEDVTVRVAVHDEPLRGKATAAFLFGVLTKELAPFALVDEIVEGDLSVVLFTTALREQHAEGLNVVQLRADDGLVSELTVFFRPLSALQLIAEVIGGHMARRAGHEAPRF